MLSTIVTAAFLSFDLSPVVDAPPGHAFHGAMVQAVVSTSPYNFTARNTSEVNQIFLFGTEDGRQVVPMVVPPGGELDFPFPSGTPAGLALQIVSRDGPEWRSSSSLSLTPFRDEGSVAFWLEAPEIDASVWVTHIEGLHLMGAKSLLPSQLERHLGPRNPDRVDPMLLLEPTHVPVITPSDKPSGDGPPVLEDKPLPPV